MPGCLSDFPGALRELYIPEPHPREADWVGLGVESAYLRSTSTGLIHSMDIDRGLAVGQALCSALGLYLRTEQARLLSA